MGGAERVAVGLILGFSPVLAFASGISAWALVQILLLPAVISGVIGGIVTGAIDARPGRSIGVTIVVGLVATLGYVAWLDGARAFRLDDLIFLLGTFVFVSAIALVIVFFVAFGLAAMARDRISKRKAG